jgi:hypothetical protein
MKFHCIDDARENYKVERQRHYKQVNYTQDSSYFPRKKEELPWVGFEPNHTTTFLAHRTDKTAGSY